MMNPFHLSQSVEHGTPPEYIELARAVLGAIDLDPASSSYWNEHLVKAAHFYDERVNGLELPWQGRVFLNPPGGEDAKGGLVRQFWERLIAFWREGRVHSAVWLGYSLQQLTLLQSSPMHPLQFFTCVPVNRIAFMLRPAKGGPPERSKSPMHGNYVTLLQTRTSPAVAAQQARRFVDQCCQLGIGGAIVRPL